MFYKLKENRVVRTYLGGQNLEEFFGRVRKPSYYPELWIASMIEAKNGENTDKVEGLSVTEEGLLLKDVVMENPEKVLGKSVFERFGSNISVLLKLLDADERLVIQAHPTVEFSEKNFNSSFGKTEAWYSLRDGGYIYLGFKEGITKEKWKDAFYSKDSQKLLSYMHRFDLKKGDVVFVDGGVPHSIGAGCFIAEIQEPSDLMVCGESVSMSGRILPEARVHGGLGYDLMFDCFIYDGMSEDEIKDKYFIKPKTVNENVKILLDTDVTDKFRLAEITVNGEYSMPFSDDYYVLVVIDGMGKITDGTKEYSVKSGDQFFVCSAASGIIISGDLQFIAAMP